MERLIACFKLSILGFLLLQAIPSMAQRSQIDSLLYLLENAEPGLDSIDVLLSLARTHMLGEPPLEKSMDYAQKALEISIQIKDKAQEANANLFVAMIKRNLSQEHQGEFEAARNIALQSKDPNAIAFTTYVWVENDLHNPDFGISILNEILNADSSQLSKKNLGNIYKVLAYQYELITDYPNSEMAYLKAIQIFQSIGIEPRPDPQLGRISASIIDGGKVNLLQTLNYISRLYILMGQVETALSFANRGLKLAETMNVSDQAWAAYWAGGTYEEAGQYEMAINSYLEAINIYKNLNEPAWYSATLALIANVYLIIKDYPEAEKRLFECLKINQEVPNDHIAVLKSLGDLYYLWGKNDLSISYYQTSDSIAQQIGDKYHQVDCQLAIAKIQLEEGFAELALQRIQDQIPKIQDQDLLRQLNLHQTLSKVHLKLNDFSQAIDHAQKSLTLARSAANNLSETKFSHELLSTIYKASGDFEKSLFHLSESIVYQDSIFLGSVAQSLKEEEVKQNILKYQTEKDQAERIAQIRAQQNRLYLFLAGILLSLLIIGTYLYWRLRKTRKLLDTQNLQLTQLNQTKDRFFGIIAHDLRSPMVALESVEDQMSFYLAKNDPNKLKRLASRIGDTTRQLNALLDNLLNWALGQTGGIPYHPEEIDLQEILSELLALFQSNLDTKGIILQNKIQDSSPIYADSRAVQTILRNIISNAIKFTSNEGVIEISSKEQAMSLTITIKDSGTGMSQTQLDHLFTLNKKSKDGSIGEKGTGLGLILVKDLVEMNKGCINIQSQINKGTQVEIIFPKAK